MDDYLGFVNPYHIDIDIEDLYKYHLLYLDDGDCTSTSLLYNKGDGFGNGDEHYWMHGSNVEPEEKIKSYM